MNKLPWGSRNKLSDDEFYGREKELNNMKNLLYSTEQSNAPEILLTGVRGVGKTVFLNKIKKELNDEGYLCILIDFSTSQSYQRNNLTTLGLIKHYYNEIIRQTNEKDINLITSRIKKYLTTNNFEIKDMTTVFNLPFPIIESNEDESRINNFVLDLPQHIYEEHKNTLKGVIILIDEFQIIKELNEYMNSFLWQLRGNIQNHNNVGYIITGSLSIDDQLINDIASQNGAFGGRIITQYLTPFTKKTTEEYLNEKAPYLKFSNESFERFYKCTNGIPYYINTLANQLPTDISLTKEDIVECFDNNLYFLIKYLINTWIRLTNREKDIFITLLDKPLHRNEIGEKLNVNPASLSKYFTKLTKLGLIKNDNGLYSIKELMIKRWLEVEFRNNGYYPYR